MEKKELNIDLPKLRSFMSRRKTANARVLSLTDEMLDVRAEIQRVEQRHAARIRGGQGKPQPGELAELEGLKQQRDQLLEDRDKASKDNQSFAFVEELIAFARRSGINVDTDRGTAYVPVAGQPKQVMHEGGVKA